MKIFVIAAMSFNFFSFIVHAETAAKGGVDRSQLPQVKEGQALCRKIQGFMSQPMVALGVSKSNSQCDRFVLENISLGTVKQAMAVCKSPDLDGQSRSEEAIAACFEKAADMIGGKKKYLLTTQQALANEKFLADSKKCKSKAFCLKQLFNDSIEADQKQLDAQVAALRTAPVIATPQRPAGPAVQAPQAQPATAPQQTSATVKVPTLSDPTEMLKARKRIAQRKGAMF